MPDDAEAKTDLAMKLSTQYEVSLLEYARSLTEDNPAEL